VLLKEKISIENFEDKKFKIKLIESKKDTDKKRHRSCFYTLFEESQKRNFSVLQTGCN